MFHLSLPAIIAGALFTAGTAATATVLYTSGPLADGGKEQVAQATATLTATATGAAGTATATGTPTPGGVCGPETPENCYIPAPGDLPPPPGVRNEFLPWTPPAVVLTPVGTPPGFQLTPTPRPGEGPVGPSYGTPVPVPPETTALLYMKASRQLSLTVSHALSKITGDLVLPCGDKCEEETDPLRLWRAVLDYCGTVPPGGYSSTYGSLWHPAYRTVDDALSSSCHQFLTTAQKAEPRDNDAWKQLARLGRAGLVSSLEGLTASLLQDGIATDDDLRAYVVARGQTP